LAVDNSTQNTLHIAKILILLLHTRHYISILINWILLHNLHNAVHIYLK